MEEQEKKEQETVEEQSTEEKVEKSNEQIEDTKMYDNLYSMLGTLTEEVRALKSKVENHTVEVKQEVEEEKIKKINY